MEIWEITVCSLTENQPLFSPYISSSSLLLHLTCTISSQSSLLNPINHPQWSLFSNHQLTPVSRLQTAPRLWNKLPPILRVPYQFDPSSSPSSSPSSCSDPGPFVDLSHGIFNSRLKAFLLTVFHPIYPFLRLISWNYDLSLFGSHWQW